MKLCILSDQQHCGEAKANNVESMNAEPLKKVNKNKKKLVKKLANSYDAFLASESLIKQIPRLLGPEEVKSTIKFQMKKVLCLYAAVGHDGLKSKIPRRVPERLPRTARDQRTKGQQPQTPGVTCAASTGPTALPRAKKSFPHTLRCIFFCIALRCIFFFIVWARPI
ncbi:60S ribosomal protein L10a-2 [Drosophila ananassae]|uniref:60S ribosomal protein L10a-2 n=1 Tax=Drosophila ananassae TaxID=7217 RepID=UPI0013A5CFEB|nr:60S ribosomal protein L10a-2 [Drosophila ananassae]